MKIKTALQGVIAGVALLAAAGDAGAEERQLFIYNWADYIGTTTIADFEKETGIKVTYDLFDGYETMDARVQAGSSGYDIICPGRYYISDWSRRQGNFFRSIQVTKSIMFFVLLLVVAVAAFNIIATLVMVVKEKRADIAILRTLGGSPREMLTIFMTQGSVIGVVGTATGVLLGLLVAANVSAIVAGFGRLTGIMLVDPRVYFISELPSDIRAGDILLIAGVALALGVLATLYPAWRASKTLPAEALRHEV